MANSEVLIPIPGRLHSVATSGHVAGADEIYDDSLNKDQETINAEVAEALGEGGTVDEKIAEALENVAFIDDSSSSPAVVPSFDPESQTVHITAQTLSEAQKAQVRTNIGLGDVDAKINQAVASEASQRAAADSSLQSSINAEATARANAVSAETSRAQAAEEQLRTLYNNLQQSQPIPVTSLPATGEAGKIYRLASTNSYADYMYAEGALTTPIKMAEYDNAIDDVPTAGSDNLVKSGSINNVGGVDDLLYHGVQSETSVVIPFDIKLGGKYYFLIEGEYNWIDIAFRKDYVATQDNYIMEHGRLYKEITATNNYDSIQFYIDGIVNSVDIKIFNTFIGQKFNSIDNELSEIKKESEDTNKDIINRKNDYCGLIPVISDSEILNKYSRAVKSLYFVPTNEKKNHNFGIIALCSDYQSSGKYQLMIQDMTEDVGIFNVEIDITSVENKNNVSINKTSQYYGQLFGVIDFGYIDTLPSKIITFGVVECYIQKIEKGDIRIPNKTIENSPSLIWWCGTSIPETGYPYKVAENMHCNIYNVAKGSSMIRRGSITSAQDPIGLTGIHWENIGYSLSQTLEDKEDLIDNWDTYRTMMTGNPPQTLTNEMKELFRNCSYERKLIPYLEGRTYDIPDLYVIDHGRNDWMADFSDEVPENPFDKQTFIGAENFIIAKILEYHPRARIVIVGDYIDAVDGAIVNAQKVIADYWNIPIIKSWELTGFSNAQIYSDGYWDNGVWHDHGNPGGYRMISTLYTWMEDTTHPYTQEAQWHIANLYSKQLSLLY